MKKLDGLLDKIEEVLLTLFSSVMAISILIQVINRNTVKLPFSWGEELARYCMVWVTFIGISAGVKLGAHIGVDALVNILPGKIKKGVKLISNVLVTVIYIYLTKLSVEITLGIKDTRQVSPAMQIPMYIIYTGLIVGMVLSSLRSIQITLACLQDDNGQTPNDLELEKMRGVI